VTEDNRAVIDDDTEQPDGIASDSLDLPTPAGAARRVNDFLAWYGDGLVYAETGAPPLFARDLQALANLGSRASEERATEGGQP
jgi:hypothetical protein